MTQKPRRKRRTTEEIREEIYRFLEDIDFPTTTRRVADEVDLNWYAANTHLSHLMAEGKVFHKRVGRQNQWWTENVNESRRMIKVLKDELNKRDKRIRELEDEIKKLKKF